MEILPSWKEDEEPDLRTAVLQHMRVLPNFVSEDEEAALLAEVEPQLKRMRYEFDHWDNVRFCFILFLYTSFIHTFKYYIDFFINIYLYFFFIIIRLIKILYNTFF